MSALKKETACRVLEKFDSLSAETQLFILGVAQGYMLLKEKQETETKKTA